MEGINLEIKGKEIILRKKLNKDETYKLNNREKTCSLVIYKKLEEAIGVTSLCGDGRHIIMIDWDNVCKWIPEKDVKKVIYNGRLSPFYLFCSKERKVDGEIAGNYQAYCLTKKYPFEIAQIQRETHCDKAYITMPLRNIYKSWVIRTSNKGKRERPKFLKVIGKSNLDNEISEAHLNLLNKLYKIPKIKYSNLDGSKTLFRNVYKTGNF